MTPLQPCTPRSRIAASKLDLIKIMATLTAGLGSARSLSNHSFLLSFLSCATDVDPTNNPVGS
jgi:hypothetical protein